MEKIADDCLHALRHNLALSSGENVLIITDRHKASIAAAFEEAARAITANVELVEIPVPAVNGAEPPYQAAEKMKHADVVLMPVSKSLSWTRARMAATAAGARVASMARLTEDIIARTFSIDYKLIRRRVNGICDLLDRAHAIHVKTDLGTDLHIKIAGRQGRGRKGGIYDKPGYWGNLPCGESFIAPVEGSSRGVYVVDASHAGVGKLETPVTFHVNGGRVVKIDGGKEAEHLRSMLASVGDVNAYNIAEFGVGCNDKAALCGITLEDEKVLGTCHIALGNNAFFGGKVEVAVHVDGVMKAPTIFLDGSRIMESGKLLI